MSSNVFSEYEYRQLGFTVGEAGSATLVDCVGAVEETMTVRTVTKKCRGVVRKQRSRGTGAGTLKVTGHWPYDLYTEIFGMGQEGLAAGVTAYGENSLHPTLCITADVFDEDDVEKFKAWPRCTVSSDMTRKTTNGDEEVAEVDIEFAVMPDEDGNGLYEALADGLDEGIASAWMGTFTADLVKDGAKMASAMAETGTEPEEV